MAGLDPFAQALAAVTDPVRRPIHARKQERLLELFLKAHALAQNLHYADAADHALAGWTCVKRRKVGQGSDLAAGD